MIAYRIEIKVGYCIATFEFDNANEAVAFATNMLQHRIADEDSKRPTSVTLTIVDIDAENAAKEQEEE